MQDTEWNPVSQGSLKSPGFLIYSLMSSQRFSLLLAAFLLAGSLLAQDRATTLRLAQSSEQAGDHERAARLYEELYRGERANVVYFEGLVRALLQLKRYDDASGLMEERLEAAPADVNLRARLGGVYYRAAKEMEAAAAWERAIAVAPASAATYRTVAAVLVELRLLERAAETYRRARIACDDANLFTAELANLLAVTMDYAGATAEYLRFLKGNPTQLGFVQGRMAAYTGREEGRAAAVAAVRSALREEETLPLFRLLGWLYLEGKRYDEAFEVYRQIDVRSAAAGGEIAAFADRALREHAFTAAARAYRAAIDFPVARPRLPQARYGYATALKELATDSSRAPLTLSPTPETAARLPEALREYEGIIRDYPRSEYAARSWYQIGLLQLDHLGDLDAALRSFDRAAAERPGLEALRHDAALRAGAVLLAAGDTAGAAGRFTAVASAPTAVPDQQDEATFRLAEIAYFGGDAERATALLSSLAVNLTADYANDALALLTFLQENTAVAPAAVAAFGAADFLARRRKDAEAAAAFLALVTRHPGAPLVDDALLRAAALEARTGRYADALATYERLFTEFAQSSIALDRARFQTAEIYQFGLRDPARAVAAYEQLLVDHPQSLLVTLARTRIRELRGDTL